MDYLITILVSIISGISLFALQMVIRENRDLKKKKARLFVFYNYNSTFSTVS